MSTLWRIYTLVMFKTASLSFFCSLLFFTIIIIIFIFFHCSYVPFSVTFAIFDVQVHSFGKLFMFLQPKKL